MEQVDALFSFSGNVSYLQENLPYVDKVMGYLKSLSAEDALPCFPRGRLERLAGLSGVWRHHQLRYLVRPQPAEVRGSAFRVRVEDKIGGVHSESEQGARSAT
jgi:hypothetical protein